MSTSPAQLVLQSSPEYQSVASRLRDGKIQEYNFTRAQLRDVLRFLAEDAGVSFMALPESEGDKDKLITFKVNTSPFLALETVANTYGVALIYDNGIWHMRPLDDKQLIGRTYHIKYNSQELVTTVQSGNDPFGPMGRAAQIANMGATDAMGASSASAGESAMGASTNINLQGGPIGHLAANADELVKDIKEILGIPTRGFDAITTRNDVTVDDFGKDPMHTPQKTYNTAEEVGEETKDKDSEPAVFWNSDTNNLFIVCTRQQHQLVEAYLSSVDRPQPLIAVEVKFFETTRDPRKQMGVDWSETLDGGIPVNFSQATADGEILPDWNMFLNFDDPSNNKYPEGAVLSTRSANIKIQALLADRQTTSVSYPRVLTQNNREVVIRNVVNKPVLAASASTTPGLGGTTTQTIQYLPIGTTINILPKVLSDGTVALTVNLQLSNIIGSEIIGGNAYPVATSRLYTAPLKVESGYTVAIAGLDEAFDSREGTGVPFLSKIPIIGLAFKNTQRERSKKSLMMFITPTVLSNDTEGISETPQSTLPVRKEDPARRAPQFYPDGTLAGGPAAIGEAVAWADRQERYLRKLIEEHRHSDRTSKDITLLRKVCSALIEYIEREKQAYPSEADRLDLQQWNVQCIKDRALTLRIEKWRNSFSDFLGH
ncbi:MAG: type II secretion system protein GspD [Verrucomicrobiales bacterium]